MHFWEGKNCDVVSECSQILAKMDVLTDPGAMMPALLDVLAQRSLFTKCLLKTDRIKLSLPKLISVLEKLIPLQSDTIMSCLQEDSSKWETLAAQSANKEEVKESHLTSEQVKELYDQQTVKL